MFFSQQINFISFSLHCLCVNRALHNKPSCFFVQKSKNEKFFAPPPKKTLFFCPFINLIRKFFFSENKKYFFSLKKMFWKTKELINTFVFLTGEAGYILSIKYSGILCFDQMIPWMMMMADSASGFFCLQSTFYFPSKRDFFLSFVLWVIYFAILNWKVFIA